jgi:hypothetical protein
MINAIAPIARIRISLDLGFKLLHH